MSLFQTLTSISEKAIAWLLLFLHALLKYCGKFSNQIQQIATALPHSPYLRDKYLSYDLASISKHVVCPSCHSLYSYDECLLKTGSRVSSKQCSHVSYGKRCNAYLLKEVVSISGNSKMYPRKLYCYSSLLSSLKAFLSRPGFIEDCEANRCNGNCPSTSLSDVYDGKIWKEFTSFEFNKFLAQRYSYALMLNVDWFQPFENFAYSVGVIYLVILNLPRTTRYKRENIILVGVIPGPSEPSLNINTYLEPLVDELLKLWRGVQIEMPNSNNLLVRGALVAVSCDLPAGRKVCGFLSHSASLGCSRCYTEFSEGFAVQNYSNFNRNQWKTRNNKQHRADINSLKNCKNITVKRRQESKIGCRYSVLLELPYFDPIRMLLIDPMHCLFLGSAKYVAQKIWIGKEILKSNHLDVIHERLSRIQVPLNIGRLPSKIDSGVTFTAEQWMNWTIYFSIYCLYGLLSSDQLECWRHFVLACRKLCQLSMTKHDVTVADGLLLQFGKRVKHLYGEKVITPNMHMACHIADCIMDYGPSHSFWLFAFERYNGLLGNQPNNNRAIEPQLLNRFLKDNLHLQLLHSSDSQALFDQFGSAVCLQAKKFESTASVKTVDAIPTFNEPMKYTLDILNNESIEVLKQVYGKIYPEHSVVIMDDNNEILASVRKCTYIQMEGKKLSSVSEGLNSKVPYILGTPLFPFDDHHPNLETRPAQIQYFIKHHFSVQSHGSYEGISKSHLFAVVNWPQTHPECFKMGKPVELWCKDLFEPSNINDFLLKTSFPV